MRRNDREVTNRQEILDIMAQCAVCRIALPAKDAPYIVPMNFGLVQRQGQLVLYFHCANEGRKLALIGQGAAAAFEMDCRHRLLGDSDDPCVYSYAYASVMGTGRIEPVRDCAEKETGLAAIMRQQTGRAFAFAGRDLRNVTVLRLAVEALTAKRHRG